jgi:hypothetical protein
MKHKYVFNKDNDSGQLSIKEYAELSKEIFSVVCESNCDIKQIEEAMTGGDEAVVAKIRTQSFFPPGNFMERIVHSVTEMIASGEQSVAEIYCDDNEFLTKSLRGAESYGSIDDETDESADEFMDDDLPDDFDGDVKPGSSGVSIDIEDDIMEDEDD